MKRSFRNLILSLIIAIALLIVENAGLLLAFHPLEVSAASFNYPVQEMKLGIGDTNRNISISATTDDLALNSGTSNGSRNEKWYLNYISNGVYEIVNSQTGFLITNSNGACLLKPDTDAANQRWKIVGVTKDFEGKFLYYKIVSNTDANLAITFNPNNNSLVTSSYTGGTYQKFKLNCDGLEGFAANSKVAQGEKAGTIGGLLGRTVFVDTVDELKNALNSTESLTVVVSANLDCKNEGYIRIRDNKTLVGSYAANRIQDCMLRTNNEYGKAGDEPSDNIVIRNIDFEAVANEDKILVQIWSSRYIWIDHCTFNSQLGRNKDEVGKFIWINTPYTNYMDAKDNGRSPDYITISYNIFKNRYWTVAYGTQNTDTSKCKTSIMYNKWDSCVRRCPQIGNGNGHIYNNYHVRSSSDNDSGTSQIIRGDGSTIYTQDCRFESLKGVEVSASSNEKYRDSGSYTSDSNSSTPYPLEKNLGSSATHTWEPSKENYGYELIAAYNTSNTDVKVFCNTYSGSFNAYSKIKYITDADMASFVKGKYASPFLKSVTVGSIEQSAVMDTTVKYMFKNVNSGLYLDVDGAKAANGTNVQQWGANGEAIQNTWKLIDAGNGYYYIRSSVSDGKSYFLNVAAGSTANGANIEIYQKATTNSELFKFVPNSDGSYTIVTKATNDASCVAVSYDSNQAGANVIQWASNNNTSQKWVAEKITTKDGVTLDESKCYMLKNVNSGLYMEVDGAKQANSTNVQQWGAAVPASHNVWTVKSAGWGYYYLYSAIGDARTYALNVKDGSSANGANIDIYEKNGYSTQFFKFVDNEDGSYTIVTRASKDLSCVEVANALKTSGANVQQYALNGNNCQKWILEEVKYTLPN